jgi:hypothetical protein
MAKARSTTKTAPRVTTRDAPSVTPRAITVPGGMRLLSTAKVGHDTTLRHATCDVRVPIPAAKLAAVRSVLASNGPNHSIDIDGSGGSFSDGRGLRIRFTTAKTEAELNTFLAAVEEALA